MSGLKKRTAVAPVYCSAHKTNGDPCRRRPINGGTVCATHGGRAPQVKAAAQRRILAASDRAAAAIVGLMEDRETPHAVKLAAARDLLDRAGLSMRNELTVEVKPWEGVIDRILVDDPRDPGVISALPAEPEAPEDYAGELLPEPLAARSPKRSEPASPPTPPAVLRPPVEPASFDSTPPGRLDPDGLARRPAARRRKP